MLDGNHRRFVIQTRQALIGQRAEAVQPLRVEELGLRIAQKELNKQTDADKPTLDFVANLGGNRSRDISRTRSSASQTDQTTATGSSTSASTGSTASTNTFGSTNTETSTESSSQTSSQSTVDTSSSRPASRNRSYGKQWDAYIGVRLNIPLYDGGLTSSRVRESLALQEQKDIDLQRVRAEAALAAETAYLEAAGFLAEAQALKTAETSGRVALEANQMGYEVGLRINSDVLNAQQQLFTTRRDLMRAQVDALVATLRLKASAGALGEAEIKELDRWLK